MSQTRHDTDSDADTVPDEPSAAVTMGDRRSDQSARTETLFGALAALPAASARRGQVRNEIVALHRPLAEHLARRFAQRGEPLEDLCQVATIGLLKAVDGFDSTRGVAFASYAVPTMLGEIKRHFRDKGWSLRVPRRLKELMLDVRRAQDGLTQQLGRTPTVADLAEHLGVGQDEVRECLVAAQSYSAMSLSTPVGEDDDTAMTSVIGGSDNGYDVVEDRESLRPLLRRLPSRQQRIVAMRFYGNMTQSQIAERVGISQMHVSRLLSRSLAELRVGLVGA